MIRVSKPPAPLSQSNPQHTQCPPRPPPLQVGGAPSLKEDFSRLRFYGSATAL